MDTILLTCGYCGGRIDLDDESIKTRVCVCKYCRSTVLIPEDRTRIENWYNRAVFHRMNGDFDNAIKTYERILVDDNSDPEAHWGLALSKNGIEYVDDPKTGDKVPTCHRTKEQTILSDPEYLAAMSCADENAQIVIEREAKRIHEIQKKILEISRSEPPYDVFISYKELDDTNTRTKDSVLAQDLYSELQKKGYKVFFARKTLEKKLGHEYEPIIYAALSSAKVMVVLGTQPEHFNAVWVRNEWRRYQLMAKDSGKTIIVAYRDMFPDQLPNELSSLMALDMSRIGFLQELVDGVGRCLGETDGAEEEGHEKIGRERLAKNGNTFIDLGKFDKAKASFEQMTEMYPEDYRGWWGLLECETNRFSMSIPDNLNLFNGWYVDAFRTAPTSKKEELRGQYYSYLKTISPDLAAREINYKKRELEDHSKAIKRLDDYIAKRKITIKEEETVPQKTLENMEKRIGAEKESIAKINHESTMHTIAMVSAIAFFLLGLILFGIGGFGKVLLGIVSIIAGIVVFGINVGNGPKGNIETHVKRIEQYKQDKEKEDSEAAKRKDSIKREIEKKEEERRKVQDEVELLEKYCSKPVQAVADELYAKYTAEIDEIVEELPSPSQIREGSSAPTKKRSPQKEDVVINCPACGNQLTGNRDNLLAAGFIKCDHCGTRISVGRKM